MIEVMLTVNGEPYPLKRLMTVSDLLEEPLIPTFGLIVEYNGTLYNDQFELLQLQAGDIIEFIHFMGGGC